MWGGSMLEGGRVIIYLLNPKVEKLDVKLLNLEFSLTFCTIPPGVISLLDTVLSTDPLSLSVSKCSPIFASKAPLICFTQFTKSGY